MGRRFEVDEYVIRLTNVETGAYTSIAAPSLDEAIRAGFDWAGVQFTVEGKGGVVND